MPMLNDLNGERVSPPYTRTCEKRDKKDIR